MRLYLSSFGLGNQPQRLVNLVAGHSRAVVILNAYDELAPSQRALRLEREITALQHLGLTTTELDLRHYFAPTTRPNALAAVLHDVGLIWVRGGNTFVLRRAMEVSGFAHLLPDLLTRDALVYGGYSAGIVVLSPSLHGIDIVDDPYRVPDGYNATPIWEGLGIVPYAFAPHYQSDHPEAAAVATLVQYYSDHNISYKALRDGEVLVVHGNQEEIIV